MTINSLLIFLALAFTALSAISLPEAEIDFATNYTRPTLAAMSETVDIEQVNRYLATLGADPLSNISAFLDSQRSEAGEANISKDGRLQVEVRMGGPRQHIGTVRKQRLYNAIYTALKEACPQDQNKSGVCCAMCGRNNYAYFKQGIVYNAGKAKYATNAWVTVEVNLARQDPQYKELWESMYEVAAKIYTHQAEQNCYEIDFKNSRRTKMCNVGRSLSIGLPAIIGEKNMNPFLYMTVSFNGKTTEGPWDCNKGIEEQAVTAVLDANLDEKLAKELNVAPAAFLTPRGICAEKDCEMWQMFRSKEKC